MLEELLIGIIGLQLAQCWLLWRKRIIDAIAPPEVVTPPSKPSRDKDSITHVRCMVEGSNEQFAVRLRNGLPPKICTPKNGIGSLVYTNNVDPASGCYLYKLKLSDGDRLSSKA